MSAPKYLFLITILLCGKAPLTSCRQPATAHSTPASYLEAIESWRRDRVEHLKAPDSWLSLAGLYELQPGPNRFGSAADNELRFPEPAPPRLGVFHLAGETVTVQIEPGREVRLNDSLITHIDLPLHSAEQPAIMSWTSLSWLLLERGGRYFIRLRDADNKAIRDFTAIDYFPVNANWRFEARYLPAEAARTIIMKNVLDMELEYRSEGRLQFEKDGEHYQLEVLDGGPEEFFVIFADESNGGETYAGGRYLYVSRPNDQGITQLDFNKAYNPPCVFTEYATCLLPPPQNHLPFVVPAGEKVYRH